MKKLLLVCVFTAVFAQLSAQCLMYPVPLSQRIPQASLVVEGKVIDQVCFWNAEHNRIYTSNLVDVYKTFKNTGTSYIEVITEGGTIGDKKHVLHPTLNLFVGDVGVFTLIPNGQPAQFGKTVYEAYASAQGFIKYNVSENTATEPFQVYHNVSTDLYPMIEQMAGVNYTPVKTVNPFQQPAVNSTQAVAAITNFSPTTISAGTYSVLTINGTGFGATANASLVAFKNADDGGASTVSPLPTEIISWSNTQIQVKVPSKAGTGVIRVNGSNSTGVLTIPYSHINIASGGNAFYTKHYGQASGGYVWTYNTAFKANTAAKAAFERSMNSWRCNTLVNWTLAPGTSAISASASDGVNIVTFNPNLASGVLGVCANYFQGCGSGAGMSWFVSELDIQFDPTPGSGSASWQYGPANPSGSQYDFESVTVHELGHGHELGHVINSADLMHYAIGAGQVKRTINSDDLAGGLAVMNRNTQAGGTCSNTLMTPLTASACSLNSLNAVISSSITGCLNQAITLTDGSSGSPTTWSWSMPGGTPASATSQNTSVTYATTGSKVVSLTVTSGTGTSTTSQTITVSAVPVLSVTPTSTTICTGQSTILKVSGATTYSWTPGPSNSSSYIVTPSGTTTYTVTGTNSGCVSTPVQVTVNMTTCTGLKDLESHNELSVYPNPSNGVFTISSTNNTGKLDVSVINMLGQNVKTESSKDPKNLVIDLSTYSKGVYYLKIQMNDGSKLMKVILN